MTVFVKQASCPYQQYLEFATARSTNDESLLIVPFAYQQYWLDNQPIDLAAIYRFTAETIQFGVVQLKDSSLAFWESEPASIEAALTTWLSDHDASLFEWDEPISLNTVSIPKPWGQEIWYTGVEQRGVACFSSGGRDVPIPYLLEVMPSVLGKVESRALVLLKILDPLPEEVFGDLYFELHREKQEVYVVTNVDSRAWPDGSGNMRMGFDPEKIEQAGSEIEFKKQFLAQVLAYRKIRFQIDAMLDHKREQQGIAIDAELTVDQLKQWLAEIPDKLSAQEKELRQQMESYFGSLPLKTGDVVKVPLNVPHSLQHGVRTIEFQTPVYERRIISFAQKVLTQKNWDTEQGIEEMRVVSPSLPELRILSEEDGVRVEQVVEFSDFEVQRVTLSDSHSYHLAADVYQLLIVIEGVLIAGKQNLVSEQAALIRAGKTGISVQPLDAKQVAFLVAKPKYIES